MSLELMIDIETLGTAPGCVITEIAAVVFCTETGRIADRIELLVDRASCERLGMFTDPATLQWMQEKGITQRDGVRFGIDSALGMLRHFVNYHRPKSLWCWGASFDFPILEEAFARCGMAVPWKYWQQRCARTIHRECTGGAYMRPAAAHTALDDCFAQVSDLVGALRTIQTAKKIS